MKIQLRGELKLFRVQNGQTNLENEKLGPYKKQFDGQRIANPFYASESKPKDGHKPKDWIVVKIDGILYGMAENAWRAFANRGLCTIK